MVELLVVFLRSGNRLDEDDYEIITSYNPEWIKFYAYDGSDRDIAAISTKLKVELDLDWVFGRRLDGPLDGTVMTLITNDIIAIEKRLVAGEGGVGIDITNASGYHGALCQTIGYPGLSKISISKPDDKGCIKHQQISTVVYDYENTDEREKILLKLLSTEMKDSKDIANVIMDKGKTEGWGETEKQIRKSVAKKLEKLHDMGLILKGLDPNRKYDFKPCVNYYFSEVQAWHYKAYGIVEMLKLKEKTRR